MFITHQPPSLERIPESPPPDLDTVSYMEITPSGNLEELERGADSDKHSDDVDGEIERVPPAVNDDMNVAALKEKLLAQSADNNVVMRPKKPGELCSSICFGYLIRVSKQKCTVSTFQLFGVIR